MARKEVTIVQRVEMLRHSVKNAARNIADYLDSLESLEKDMKLEGPALELFRLCVRSIRFDVSQMANDEERKHSGE